MSAPKLTIGLPVYEGGVVLERALASIESQSFTDWMLVVGDNASSDNTGDIVMSFVRRDSRIRYVRHAENLGASANFVFLAQSAKTKYFMWAAADDEYSTDYISECVRLLEAEDRLGFAGGSVVNIDPMNEVIRICRPFDGLDSPSSMTRLANYTLEREIDGKANLIYSVFRSELVKKVCMESQVLSPWGADMALVTAALAHAPYKQAPRAILRKRVTSPADIATARAIEARGYGGPGESGSFPLRRFPEYLGTILRGLPTLRARSVVLSIMLLRVVAVGAWRVSRLLRSR